jgi:ADP-ribosylglycohydrolase
MPPTAQERIRKPSSTCLLGAIAGDMIGAPYEHHAVTDPAFPLFTEYSHFTDDTVLTIAVADALINQQPFGDTIREYARRYPHAGYGGFFRKWMYADQPRPYNSYGNGSAMRVSPVGWAFETTEDVLRAAEQSAACTHNHPEGIKGAQSVALAIFLARQGASKAEIKVEVESRFGYNLSRRLAEIRPEYRWSVTCPGSVPESIIAFLESTDFESAVRNAISLCGDADTMAAIAGSIAEPFYGGVPDEIAGQVRERMPPDLWIVTEEFRVKYYRAGVM